MKILFVENVYGWVMTGLLGKDGKWFLGYSHTPREVAAGPPVAAMGGDHRGKVQPRREACTSREAQSQAS